MTGIRITEVMADLHTFIPTRRQPTGPVETFSTERAADTVEREIGTEDTAMILLRFENGARGTVAISQLSAGRKNSLEYEIDGSASSVAWDSEQPDQLWIGHRDARERDPHSQSRPDGRRPARSAAALPGGHVEGFADTFRALFRAIYDDVGEGDRRTSRRTRPSPTATTRCSSATRSRSSAQEGRWTPVMRQT